MPASGRQRSGFRETTLRHRVDLAIAVAVAARRVLLDVHWVSGVVAGLALGWMRGGREPGIAAFPNHAPALGDYVFVRVP